MVSPLYAGLLFIAGLTSLFAVRILWKWRSIPSAIPLMVFMVSLAIWSLTYSLHWLSDNPDVRFFWLAATYMGVIPAPVSIFFFALTYTDKEKWITRKFVWLVSIFPALTVLILWTDPLHGLFFGDENRNISRVFNGGIWFWLNAVYSYGLIFASYFMIVRALLRARGIYRQQVLLVLAALTPPVVLNVGGFLGFFPLTEVDTTPLIFTVTGVTIIYALYYKKLLDLVPIARDQVMQTINEPFFIMDTLDRIVDLNGVAVPLCENIVPGSSATIIGRPITEFFPDWHQWRSAAESEGQFDIGEQSYEWRISAVLNKQGRLQGRVMLLNNITRRKLAIQREFELALEKERVKLLQHFIQNTAHEIRTPLTIITSAMYLMPKLETPEQRQAKANSAERQIQRITRLLDMSLIMTELENSEIRVNDRVPVEQLLKKVSKEITNLYGNAVVLRLEASDPLPAVVGNAGYLEEALRQLLDNACRFSPPQGVVTVWAGSSEGCLRITISDQGKGISAAELPLIFNTFWRRDEAHTTHGFGIGLSITKKIIDLHHGQIAVESTPGQGTTVSLQLPVAS